LKCAQKKHAQPGRRRIQRERFRRLSCTPDAESVVLLVVRCLEPVAHRPHTRALKPCEDWVVCNNFFFEKPKKSTPDSRNRLHVKHLYYIENSETKNELTTFKSASEPVTGRGATKNTMWKEVKRKNSLMAAWWMGCEAGRRGGHPVRYTWTPMQTICTLVGCQGNVLLRTFCDEKSVPMPPITLMCFQPRACFHGITLTRNIGGLVMREFAPSHCFNLPPSRKTSKKSTMFWNKKIKLKNDVHVE